MLVHGDRAETALPEMAGAPAPRMNNAGVAAGDAGPRPAQPRGGGRRQEEMNKGGRQAPSPHPPIRRGPERRQEIAVERAILVAKKGARAAVAAVGDMTRNAGDDDAGEAGHANYRLRRCRSKLSALSP